MVGVKKVYGGDVFFRERASRFLVFVFRALFWFILENFWLE